MANQAKKPSAKSTDRRKTELAQIHIAKAQLKISDDDYRTMLYTVAKVESAADLDQRKRTLVLEHLKGLGFKIVGKRIGKRPHNMRTRPNAATSRQLQLEKIGALLTVGQKPWGYADALAKRICKVDSVAFVADYDLYKIITCLRKEAKRQGWDLSGEI